MTRLEELIAELCPNGVEYKNLGEIVTFLNGRAYKQSELLSEGKYKVLRVGNFYTNDKWYYSDLELEDDKYCDRGDLLFSWAASLGAHIWNEEKTIFHYHIWKLKFNECILSKKYLYHFLNKDIADIQNSVTKSTMVHVSMGSMEKRKIPVPPLPVQEEIVRILDTFSELTAELTVELAKRKQQYQYYRDNLIDFSENRAEKSKKLEELISELCPNGVEYKTLGELCTIYDGTHQTPKYTTSGIKFVSVENIDDLYGSKKYISIEDYEKNYKIKPQKNDIFMTRIGTIGACTVVNSSEPLAYYVTLTLIRPNQNEIISKYVKYIIESKHGRKELWRRTLVNASPIKINLGEIGKIKIPVPPLLIQKEIVAILDRFDALCNDLTSGLPAEIEARKKQYEYYRDKLLTFKEAV